jgi:hypothetical protein
MFKDKINNYKLFLIIISLGFYIFGFYNKNFSISGSQIDFYGFVFRNIDLFRENLIYALNNYGLLRDANYPLFYIFHAYLNPFSQEIGSYLFSTFIIGFLTYLIFSLCLRRLDFKLIDSLLLSSIILYLPFFTGRAYWGTSANLGWFFSIISFYFFIEVKKKSQLNYNSSNLIYIFLLCFFSAATLYTRALFIFFPIYIVLYFLFYDKSVQRKFFLVLFYFILAFPGFYLIFIWNGIYDHSNSDMVKEFHTYKNIFKNFPILLNYFFFYLWPFFILEIKETGIIIFFNKFIKSFTFIFLFFLVLNFTGHLSYLSDYDYGGGAILKLGYLINDSNNFLFIITSSMGFSMIYLLIREKYKKNLILLLPIFIIFGFPKFIFQDYLEPLIIFLFFLGFIKNSSNHLLKENIAFISTIYIMYFFSVNVVATYLF